MAFDAAIYAARRRQLAKQIGRDAVAIVTNPKPFERTEDTHPAYRANNDFYYLTGFSESNAIAVLLPTADDCEFILFNQARDPAKAQWVGDYVGQQDACDIFGATHAYSISELEQHICDILRDREHVYYPMQPQLGLLDHMPTWVAQLTARARQGVKAPSVFHDVHTAIAPLRLFKDKYELACMQQAVDVSVIAHQRAMQCAQPGINEAQLHAEIMHTFIANGCPNAAYPSIVGGGKNACILHYIDNNAIIQDGELVLIDAGAEYQHYAADITRTFPVNGHFNAAQQAIYELVLAAQCAGIAAVKPGNHWHQPQLAIVNVITQGLIDLGLLHGDLDNLIEQQAYRTFYMHGSGHWLGLSVHDVGDYKDKQQWSTFAPNMTLTVEPGIYIDPRSCQVDEKWWNIGIRIEDDIVVTTKGNTVLSDALPKTIADITSLIGQS